MTEFDRIGSNVSWFSSGTRSKRGRWRAERRCRQRQRLSTARWRPRQQRLRLRPWRGGKAETRGGCPRVACKTPLPAAGTSPSRLCFRCGCGCCRTSRVRSWNVDVCAPQKFLQLTTCVCVQNSTIKLGCRTDLNCWIGDGIGMCSKMAVTPTRFARRTNTCTKAMFSPAGVKSQHARFFCCCEEINRHHPPTKRQP